MEEVKIYTTPTCPYCTIAKEYLSKRGVPFKSYDVTEDEEALREMLSVTNGARSVPVITACGEVLIGFNAERLDQMLGCIEGDSELPEVTGERYEG